MYDLPKKIVDALPVMKDTAAGKLAKMIAAYYTGMQVSETGDPIFQMFESVKPELDASMKASESHREAGRKGGRPSTKKEPSKHDTPESIEPVEKPTKAPRFIPPTLEEVQAYCLERGNSIDPEEFIDHYQANGWKQTSGLSVKDWKAAVRTWERNDKKRRTNRQNWAWQSPPAATPFGGNTRKDPFQQLKEKMRQEGASEND